MALYSLEAGSLDQPQQCLFGKDDEVTGCLETAPQPPEPRVGWGVDIGRVDIERATGLQQIERGAD